MVARVTDKCHNTDIYLTTLRVVQVIHKYVMEGGVSSKMNKNVYLDETPIPKKIPNKINCIGVKI